jgi:hypothetical protein
MTDYEAIGMKPAVRAHFKWMPEQTEKASILAHGVALDEAPENGTPLLAAMDPAITDAMEKQGIDTSKLSGEAAFYQLKEEDPMKHRLDSEFWEEHGDRFYQNLSLLIKNIEAGTFYIRPTDSHGYCKWCQLTAVCRKEHKPTQIRAENSIQRKSHEEAFKPGRDKAAIHDE